MVKGAKKELRKRFPSPHILRALSFTDPRYYLLEEGSPSDLAEKFDTLADHYSPTNGVGVSLDRYSLLEQAERFFSVASATAKNIMTVGGAEESTQIAVGASADVVADDVIAEYERLQKATDTAERHPAVRLWRGV